MKSTAMTMTLILILFLLMMPRPGFAEDWSLEHDKKLHLGVGFFIGLTVNGVCHFGDNYQDQPTKTVRIVVPLVMAGIVGGMKEGMDATGAGDASMADWTYTMVGAGGGIALGEAVFKNYDDDKELLRKLEEKRRRERDQLTFVPSVGKKHFGLVIRGTWG